MKGMYFKSKISKFHKIRWKTCGSLDENLSKKHRGITPWATSGEYSWLICWSLYPNSGANFPKLPITGLERGIWHGIVIIQYLFLLWLDEICKFSLDSLWILLIFFFFTLGNREGNVTTSETVSKGRKFRLHHVTSEIHLQPSVEDDGVNYTCEAEHEALIGKRMRATIQLSVLCKYGLYWTTKCIRFSIRLRGSLKN